MFQSYFFIFIFLPVLLIGWYVLLHRGKDRAALIFLSLLSCVFYARLQLRAFLIFIPAVLFVYVISFLMTRPFAARGAVKNALGLIGIFSQLFLLIFYKFPYQTRFVLPVGLGFYTLRQIAFLTDRMIGMAPHYAFLDYFAYASFFPVLGQGPIAFHDEIIPQFHTLYKTRFSTEHLARGLTLFTFGLAKKLLLADNLTLLIDACWNNLSDCDMTSAPLAILLFMPALYLDFSGYCDMAEGVSRMMGLSLPVNFDSPLQAPSPALFWSRWHMTLSRFFNRCVYIPLGRVFKGRAFTALNSLIVFVVSAIWHGSGWTFVCWGSAEGLLVTANQLTKRTAFGKRIKRAPVFLKWLYTFVMTSLGAVFFRAPDLKSAGEMFRALFRGVSASGAHILTAAQALDIPETYALRKAVSFVSEKDVDAVFLVSALLLILIAVHALSGKNARAFTLALPGARMGTMRFSLGMGVLFVWSLLSFTGVATFYYFRF